MNVLEKKIAQTLESSSTAVFYVKEENALYFNSSRVQGIITQIHQTVGLSPHWVEICHTHKKQHLRRVLYRRCEAGDLFFPCVIALRLSGYQVESVDYT